MVLARHGRETRGKKTDTGASAANGGRLRFDYHVDEVNKLKMIKNRLPGHRWSNRAFPRNHADLDPHPHHSPKSLACIVPSRRRMRQQEDSASDFRLELRLWVELPKQARLEKFRIVACKRHPPVAVTAFADMLLNERNVRDRDRFVVSIRFSQVLSVVADRAANPL